MKKYQPQLPERRNNEAFRGVKRETPFAEMTNVYRNEMTSKNLKSKTIEDYLKRINKFFDFLTDRGVFCFEDVTIDLTNQYLAYLNESVSPYMARRFLGYFKTFCYSMDKYYPELKTSRLNVIKKPSIVKKEFFSYTDNDIKQIYAAIERKCDYFSIRVKTIVSIMLQTGMRTNECLNLKVQDISFTENYILITHGKMNKERRVPLSNNLKTHLRDFLQIRNSSPTAREIDILFLSDKFEPLTYNAIRIWAERNIKRYVNFSENRKWGFHQLRVRFATEFYKKFKDVKRLSYILGHADIEMTLRYVRMVDSELYLTNDFIVNVF